MAYLVDVDSYNNIDASFRSFGKRLYLDSNGTLYCAFRNLNDELEIRKSYDGGQSWYSVASCILPNIDEERKNLLYIGKKEQFFVAFNFRQINYNIYCSVLYENNSVEETKYIAGRNHYDKTGVIFEGDIGACTNSVMSDYIFVAGENFSTGFVLGSSVHNHALHSYHENSALLTWTTDSYSDKLYVGICQKGGNNKYFLLDTYSPDKILSYFKIVKINYDLFYYVAHEEDVSDGRYKLNLYKFDFNLSGVVKVATVVDTTNVGEQPILGGHYDIAKDGYGDVYIMYVKYPPSDYLFLRKFDTFTETLEDEQQLTDFKVRTPQMVSSLSNSKYIYYTYTKRS